MGNKCLYCNKNLLGLTPCSCINDKEKVKLWSNGVRKKDRIKLVNYKAKPLPKE